MSVFSDFVHQHFHEKLSALFGAGVSLIAPGDIISKIIIATVSGVLVWVITKTISWIVSKLKCKSLKE